MDTTHRPSDLDWSERIEGRRARFDFAPSRMSGLPLLIGAGVWDSFLVTFYVGLSRAARATTVAYLFPLVHAVIGAYVTWLALVRCMNRSQLTIDAKEFVLAHGPVPQRGARIPTASIERFGGGPAGTSRPALHVVTREGPPVRLSLAIEGPEQLAFVAARLNAALEAARATPPT